VSRALDNWRYRLSIKHFNVEPGTEYAHVSVTLGPQLVFPPRNEEKEELVALIRNYDRVVVDARQTDTLSKSWIRLLANLTTISEVAMKKLLVVGVNSAIKSTIDISNLADQLRLLDSIEEIDS